MDRTSLLLNCPVEAVRLTASDDVRGTVVYAADLGARGWAILWETGVVALVRAECLRSERVSRLVVEGTLAEAKRAATRKAERAEALRLAAR